MWCGDAIEAHWMWRWNHWMPSDVWCSWFCDSDFLFYRLPKKWKFLRKTKNKSTTVVKWALNDCLNLMDFAFIVGIPFRTEFGSVHRNFENIFCFHFDIKRLLCSLSGEERCFCKQTWSTQAHSTILISHSMHWTKRCSHNCNSNVNETKRIGAIVTHWNME